MADSLSAPNPSTALFYFFIITTIYFVFKYNIIDATQGKISGGVYILLLIVGEFIINLSLTDSMCGNKQYDTALFITLIPWAVIFGLLYVMLSVFPGWLSPFSNTFGYGVAKLSGLTSFFNSILIPEVTLASGTKEVNEALSHIYSDKSLLINEISQEPTSFDKFWERMKPIFDGKEYTKENKAKLLSYVKLKDNVAEYIWYMLTGTLVTSVSYNYVVNKGCSQDVKEMKKRRKEYEAKMKAKKEEEAVKPKVYSTRE